MTSLPIRDRIAFLIYDSRSGSTLLSSLLDAHPDIAVSLETEFLLHSFAAARPGEKLPAGENLRTLVDADQKLKDWGGETDALVLSLLQQNPEMNAEDLLEALFERTLADRKPDARWLVLKQGLLSTHLDRVLSRWPGAPIIHIRRDGRAVFNSKLKARNIDTGKPMQTDPKAAAARWVQVLSAVDALPASARRIEVVYEDLVRSPAETLSQVLQQLEVSPKTDMLDGSGYSERIPDTQKSIHPLVGRPPDPSRIDDWKNALTGAQIREYESAAGDMLTNKNYPLLGKRPLDFFHRLIGR